MRKWNWNYWKGKLRTVRLEEMDDRLILINLYMTQGVTLLLAAIILLAQRFNPLPDPHDLARPAVWGGGALFAVVVLIGDLLIGRWVPDDVADDGGINELLFASRPIWHIGVISAVVAVCEELLFRGAVQHAMGPYWTSIVFAFIHIRYLRHWLMTGIVFATSYGLGWLYIRTGTLWTPILAHLAIDFAMGCVIKYRGNNK